MIFNTRELEQIWFDEYYSTPRCSYVGIYLDEIIGDELEKLLYYFPIDKWEISIATGDNGQKVEVIIGERKYDL